MKPFLFILVAWFLVLCASGSLYYGIEAQDQRQGIFVEKIDIQADSTGAEAEQTRFLAGDLKAIIIENGNFTGVGGYTLNYTMPRNISLDSYNISSGSSIRVPKIKVAGSTDAYSAYPLFGKLWLNLTGAQAWGQATAYIVYG